MNNLTSKQLRELWLKFFSERGHSVIRSASVIPENDPTVLFTTAGMHPLVPYLLGQKHPEGNRLTNVQKCVRTGDIDEIGDDSHLTFFEMLGNWSLGDYFKKEMIAWSYEFLTKPEYLGIDKNRLAVSVFEGDSDCPRDNESANAWKSQGITEDRIFYLPKKCNWWGPAGTTGPCGPDTEMFIDDGREKCSNDCSPACGCGKYLEIWNDVFMQYNKEQNGTFVPLKNKNVDTGMGLERTLCILQGKKSVYDTDLFVPVIEKIEEISGKSYESSGEIKRAIRIISDHIRTAVIIIGDERGVVCSNGGQGYILRRLLRRAIRYVKKLEFEPSRLFEIADVVIRIYGEAYPEIEKNRVQVINEINKETERFEKTLNKGLVEFERLCRNVEGNMISGKDSFRLYDTHGFPIEFTIELAAENGLTVDIDGFNEAFNAHRELSHAGADKIFKGGLADNSEITTKLHTATHLMHQALKVVLNDENANQKGSNITEERLRFDFTFHRPMTEAEIAKVESIVNEAIKADVAIECKEMDFEDAQKSGAIGLFANKYGEKVKVYTMGKYSCEICGGPHASRTSELGTFKIQKEQSSGAGVRRIKAILE